jgi:outer membrane protein OmpA-like peptidoglycan-associated protein
MMRGIIFFALSSAIAAQAGAATGDRINFLACPQLRDTTPNCWTAEYEGERYYIGAQRGPNDSYLPQMKHQVLVEGVITDEPRVCGGVVLKPLKVSVMPELDPSCDSPVLSGEGLTPPMVPPRAALVSRPRDLVGGIGSFMRSEEPQPPFNTRDFRVSFDFGTDLLADQMQKRMIEILTYTKVAGAKKIKIKGYSATTLLSNGERLVEQEGLAEQRARKVGRILANFGAPEDAMEYSWADSPETPDGIGDADRRRVIVTIEP